MKRLALIGILLLGFTPGILASTPSGAYLPIREVPEHLEPWQLKTDTANDIFRQVAEGLFAVGEGYEIYPRLAESTAWSPDQKTLTIHLRNAKFSDGSPVNAQVVADSLRSCVKRSPKTLLVAVPAISGYEAFVRGNTKTLGGITVNGPESIEIHLSRQAPLLLDDLAQPDCHILKPSASGSQDLLKGALGSGPYRIAQVSSSELRLERNPYYRTMVNGPDFAVFKRTEDFGRFDQLKSWATVADVDYDPKNIDPAFQSVGYSELGMHQLIFNNAKAPFTNASVRRAVALALDYGTLMRELHWSPDTLQAGMVPLGMIGFKKRTLGNREARLAEARALLAKSGFTESHPLRFTILISNLPTYANESELWPRLFSEVPIRVKTAVVEHAERNARIDRGDFQAARVMKFAGAIEPHQIFSSYTTGSTYNPTKSREPECDRLTRAAISNGDQNERLTLYEQADQCLMEQAILVPLASIQPGYVMIRKPWHLTRTNRYLLYPYWISEWRGDESK